jgi:hypothetical protein
MGAAYWFAQVSTPVGERCSQHCVEDEYHMVFDCDAYESIRDRHRPLFDQGGNGNGDPGPVAGGFSHVGRRQDG